MDHCFLSTDNTMLNRYFDLLVDTMLNRDCFVKVVGLFWDAIMCRYLSTATELICLMVDVIVIRICSCLVLLFLLCSLRE